MSGANTNNTSLRWAEEASFGTLPGSPVWKTLEPSNISSLGATVNNTPRTLIRPQRGALKGQKTDLDSAVTFDQELTISLLRDMLPYFMYAEYQGPATFEPSAVTALGYTVPSGGALAQNTLIKVTGAAVAGNNGVKLVEAGSTGTNIAVTGLTVETLPAATILDVVGFRGASGDIEIDASQNLISTTLDFTTLGLVAGQFIKIGGELAANQFATTANNGTARIVAISANEIQLADRSTTFVADNGAGQAIDLLFGQFIRDVAVTDPNFKEASIQIEGSYDYGSAAKYEYAEGNYANELSLSLPLTSLATSSVSFVGKDTPVPTNTRRTNAASATNPLENKAFSTSTDCIRLLISEVDETGISTDFRDMTLTITNGVTPDKRLCTLGASAMNLGDFIINMTSTAIFTDEKVLAAIRNNTTVRITIAKQSEDGTFIFQVVGASLGDGSKTFTRNEKVTISATASSFEDTELGYSASCSFIPAYTFT